MEFREIRCTTKISLPIAIADDRCRRAVEALLFGRKSATSKRLDTERFKKADGDSRDVDTHRLAAPGNRRQPIAIYRQIRERVVLCTKIVEIGARQIHSVAIRGLFPYAHDFLRIRIWKGAQENGVHNRKDCRGCA